MLAAMSHDDSVPRSIRFPRDLLEELQKRSEAEHRSFNNYVVMKLRQMIDAEKKGKL